jgi:hypothetical protein
MLDIHPPEHTPQTWRDFFTHIATIVVDLLIAIGLEQSVERLHHRHQRIELEEALHADTEKVIQDAEAQQKDMEVALHSLDARIGQIQDALDKSHPLAPPPPQLNNFDQNLPDDPAWKAARSSGLIEVLPQNEIKVYSEVDSVVMNLMQLLPPSDAVLRQRAQMEWKFERNGSKIPDFSQASRQDLEEYLNILLGIKANTFEFNGICGELLAAEQAVLRGEKDVNNIQQAERTHR